MTNKYQPKKCELTRSKWKKKKKLHDQIDNCSNLERYLIYDNY